MGRLGAENAVATVPDHALVEVERGRNGGAGVRHRPGADRVECGRLQCSFVSISSSYDARIQNATHQDYVAKADVLGDEHSLLLERKRG